MPRKKIVYLPLFTRDFTGSPKLRACQPQTIGVYIFLLCRLNDTTCRGAFALSDWELKPDTKRSLTQRCLATTSKYQCLRYFAEYFATNDFPWKKSVILAALQELYKRGIIVIEEDRLIQPRMYKDSGFKLAQESAEDDRDDEPAPVGSPDNDLDEAPRKAKSARQQVASEKTDKTMNKKGTDKGTEKGTQKSTEKGTRKVHEIHARAHSIESENENNNNINSRENNSIREKGVGKTKKEKTETASLEPTFDEFWDLYDKKIARPKCEKLFAALSKADREAAMAYIPLYKAAQPEKKYRKNPETFLRNHSWNDEIISETPPEARRGEAVPATPPKDGKYKKW